MTTRSLGSSNENLSQQVQSASQQIQSAIQNSYGGKDHFIEGLANFLVEYNRQGQELSSEQTPQVIQVSLMLSSDRGGATVDLARSILKNLMPVIEGAARDPEIASMMDKIFQAAKATKSVLASASTEQKQTALRAMAAALRDPENQAKILELNKIDVEAAKERGVGDAKIDRLTLNADRLNAQADSLDTIAEQPDPINRVIESWVSDKNGLPIEKVTVPLGVIAMIYEARPNVTSDAAGICLMSGNPAILRPGSDCYETSKAMADFLQDAAASAGLPKEVVQIVPTKDRAAVSELLKAKGNVDLVIPRGGVGLTQRVSEEARVPTLLHLDGNCHTYVDKDADADTAISVVLNAKLRRPGICGATESLVMHKDRTADILPRLAEALSQNGCELVGDERACEAAGDYIQPADQEDYTTEFLDKKLSIQVVDSVDEAIDLINTNSSKHSEAIISTNEDALAKFSQYIESADVFENASTQFADGGEFGFGAEIGISTGSQPPRGPVGAQQLVSFKYVVKGDPHGGSIRSGGPDLIGMPAAGDKRKAEEVEKLDDSSTEPSSKRQRTTEGV